MAVQSRSTIATLLEPFRNEMRLLCLSIMNVETASKLITEFFLSKNIDITIPLEHTLRYPSVGGTILAKLCGMSLPGMSMLRTSVSKHYVVQYLGIHKINPSSMHQSIAQDQGTKFNHCTVVGLSVSNAVMLALTSNPEFLEFCLTVPELSYLGKEEILSLITKPRKYVSRNQFAADNYGKPVIKRNVLLDHIMPTYCK